MFGRRAGDRFLRARRNRPTAACGRAAQCRVNGYDSGPLINTVAGGLVLAKNDGAISTGSLLRRDRLLLLAFLLSGSAALGYELLWTRLLSVSLGNESLAILGVLAGFFGGMALGSWLLHERVRNSANPALLFALLESVAAAYALLSPHLLYWLAYNLPPLLGPVAGNNSSLLALVLSTLIAGLTLLPGTICMGATIAALVEARRRVFRDDPHGLGIARLYGANTLGATAGIAISVYLLMPRLGMVGASVLLSLLGFAAAGVATLWQRRQPRREQPAIGSPAPGKPGAVTSRWPYLVLGLGGFAGIGLEVVGVQVLAQIFQDTVFTFANILGVYLLGTAAGAWIYGRMATRLAHYEQQALTARLLLALTLSVPLTVWLLRFSPWLLATLNPAGGSFVGAVLAEASVAAMVFLLPTLLMGALFSQVTATVEGRGVGRAYAINTLGSACAPFVFGLLAIPVLGYGQTLLLAAAVYFLLFVWLRMRAGWHPSQRVAAAAVLVLVAITAPVNLALIGVPPGWRIVSQTQDIMGLVTVSEQVSSSGPGRSLNRALQVNRYFRMGGSLSFGEQRMGHIPLLLAPEARTALFLGVGTGATLSAARHYPLDQVDAVELVPGVLDVFPAFEHVNELVSIYSNFHLQAADARRFIAASRQHYDVIVADLFHPARDGAGSLYSQEHFRNVRDSLSPGGIFAQWLPIYQLDEHNLKTILRTFLSVFPETHSFLGLYNAQTPPFVLIGRVPDGTQDRLTLDSAQLSQRLEAEVYASVGMRDAAEFVAAYMLDRDALAAFAGPGPVNTDLDPRVIFDAPRATYADRTDLPYANLARLLAARSDPPLQMVRGADAQYAQDVGDFSTAIGLYVEGDIARARAGYPRPLSMAFLQPYLQAYRAEPGFRPAAGYLYAIAGLQADTASEIYREMLAADPTDRQTWERYAAHLKQAGDLKALREVRSELRRRFPVGSIDAE